VADDTGEKWGSAGNSSDQVDVAAVFERLKEEVRGRTAAEGVAGTAGPVGARAEAERLWPVAAAGVERRPGIRGALAYPGKRLVRILVGWYVEPFVSEQRSFNYQVLRLVDHVSGRLRTLEERVQALEAATDPRGDGGETEEMRQAPPGHA
jgi:hypothetical protein